MKGEANPLDHARTSPIPANKPQRSHIGSPPHVGGPSIDVTEVTGHPPRLVTTLDGPCIRHSVRMTLGSWLRRPCDIGFHRVSRHIYGGRW